MVGYLITGGITLVLAAVGAIHSYGRLNEKVSTICRTLDNHLKHTDRELSQIREDITEAKRDISYIKGKLSKE